MAKNRAIDVNDIRKNKDACRVDHLVVAIKGVWTIFPVLLNEKLAGADAAAVRLIVSSTFRQLLTPADRRRH